ncbi:MAG: leucyl aminopeptidase [Gammaproteobacteria bacterium]|nr:leucyl aminopeptidase [Gammaproteobacteria bacterium]NIM75063.1 leucyl aminopeptidase [Gammaproteobacteria bacterium]NIN40113.1 leucyl aminopeptidase [Gammaproteobacteria bacterium]NIO26600.1 leucyl aminopeptidase [Gammaproteobacteria bacterium]NIO67152.1 leucyl aminopeptidase [Gammaproteobacteria bacterium]
MDFRVSKIVADSQKTDCMVVGVFESHRLSPSAQAINDAGAGELLKIIRRFQMQASVGNTLMLNNLHEVAASQVMLVGCGKKESMPASRYSRVLRSCMERLADGGAEDAVVCLTELDVKDRDIYWKVREVVEIARDCVYRFNQLKTDASSLKQPRLHRVTCAIATQKQKRRAEEGMHHGIGIADGVDLARDLGNLPANVCTPTYLAERARQLARREKSIKVRVMGETEMKRLGMGTLLSVARGSEEPAKLITLEYRGSRSKRHPAVLIGKGVTFDSGGISIKPAAQMDEMKFDMCGAASVLGAVKMAASLALPINLVGIVAATENLPGGTASKPGDIYTSMSGETVEVLNTDAEGRLVLCDALTYARRFEPDVVVDIATLTGACVIALGDQAAGLFSNDDRLADALLDAGEFSGDRAWRMPVWEEYAEALKSNFADVANVGGREAGAITAACFLSRFAREYRWAHLDIAGVAWRGGKSKGATGRPVRLLSQFLLDRAGRKRVS